jgi:hypothetical protein
MHREMGDPASMLALGQRPEFDYFDRQNSTIGETNDGISSCCEKRSVSVCEGKINRRNDSPRKSGILEQRKIVNEIKSPDF